MKKIIHFFTLFPFLALIGGPLLSITLGNSINIYFSDIIVFAAFIYCAINRKGIVKVIRTESVIIKVFFLFSTVLFLSLIFSPLHLTINERVISGLYLCRFFLYFSIFIAFKLLFIKKAIKPIYITNSLIITGLVLSIIGWIQYFLYPDLRNLMYLGWDPHYMRIFSTYFDPNYLGLILVLTLISLSTITNSVKKWIIGCLLVITLAFTYSRSSFLSLFFISVINLIFKKKWMTTALVGAVFIILLLLLPRPLGNESVKLERIFTLTERVTQWKEAGDIISNYPILGVGFNTLRFARRNLSLTSAEFLMGHSGAGVDNSFLFIGVTSGIIGLLSFIFLLIILFIKISYTAKLILGAILIHGFFLNSFFLPFVMMWFWLVIADSKVEKSI
jgi:O-antigen ligase